MNPLRMLFIIAIALLSAPSAFADAPYAPWQNGPPASDNYFPIAVWLQAPSNAARYKAIGINTYVALWKGPNQAQLDELEKNGIKVICHQDLKFKDSKTIIAWMHGDEPDNAQEIGRGKGYGPPINPEKIVADYHRIKAADPTRPILLNLGQGVAYDNYIGRGVRRGKLEDYPKYLQGCDIVSFDIYPVVHDSPQIAGKLEYVPKGVARLREWSHDQKIVWNCIETTHIGSEKLKPTPEQVRSEVWMSIIHGSRGIIYFCHEWKPKFVEAGLLADKEIASTVGQINAQVTQLAPAINAPADPKAASVTSSSKDVPIDFRASHSAGDLYLFACSMRSADSDATFTLPDAKPNTTIEVIGETRTLTPQNNQFTDHYAPYAVHLYRVHPSK